MARKTITTYTCDACGADVGTSKGLERFALEHRTKNYRTWQTVMTELCVNCEAKLLKTVTTFFTRDEPDELASMHRPTPKETA